MPLVTTHKKFFDTVYNHSNCLLKCYIITWLYHKSTVKSQNQPHSYGWQARRNRVKHKGPAVRVCESTSSNKVDEYTSRTIVLDQVRYAVAVRYTSSKSRRVKSIEKYLNYASRSHPQEIFYILYIITVTVS